MCLKAFLNAPTDLQDARDPGRAFRSLGAAILKVRSRKPLSLLRGNTNLLENVERNARTLVLS